LINQKEKRQTNAEIQGGREFTCEIVFRSVKGRGCLEEEDGAATLSGRRRRGHFGRELQRIGDVFTNAA